MDVRIDNWTGGFVFGSHLINLGHCQFAAITGPMSTTCYPARLAGFRAALAQHDIVLNDTQVREGDYWSENARLHALDLLQQKNRPTAVFACSDTQAFGIYDAAHQLGLSIPEDLSVTGFDNSTFSGEVGLTTVRQKPYDMAVAAARKALDLIEGRTLDQPHEIFPVQLLVRDSTAAPRVRG